MGGSSKRPTAARRGSSWGHAEQMSSTIFQTTTRDGRPTFLEHLYGLVQCWTIVIACLTVLALAFGPVYGYGGVFFAPVLGLLAFVLALPGSVVALVILGRLQLVEGRSVALRAVGMLVLFVLANVSLVLVSLPLYPYGSNWGISDYLGWLLFTAPTAVVWALR